MANIRDKHMKKLLHRCVNTDASHYTTGPITSLTENYFFSENGKSNSIHVHVIMLRPIYTTLIENLHKPTTQQKNTNDPKSVSNVKRTIDLQALPSCVWCLHT